MLSMPANHPTISDTHKPSAPPSFRWSRRALLAGAGGALMSGCRAPEVEVGTGKRTLTVWHAWGGVMAPRWKRILAAYEESHADVRIRSVFVQNNLATNQKFFTSVAAGTPPDVTFVDGPQVASWAEWGALTPLTDRIAAAGIQAEDYFPPTWRQNVYRDQVWALTYCADPNFGFAWNRKTFRDAGLDPDKPPTTIDELTDLSERLTLKQDDAIRRIGLIPWAQYGPANSMFTWGWVFGGDFYEPATRRITADHPKLVQALEWMISYAERFDPAKIQSLAQGFGTAEQNPFYIGKLAMQCLHIGGVGEIERFAPKLDYGLTYIPAPADGERRSSWVGGWCMSIPKGARNTEDAWEFIRSLGSDPEVTAMVGREAQIFPGFRRSPYFDEVREKVHYGDYVRILEESRHQRPVMPVQAYYMRELQRAVDAAVYGRKSPAEALAQARINTQAELDLALAGA
jgi:multiple sugar transport system substrate-binding protein